MMKELALLFAIMVIATFLFLFIIGPAKSHSWYDSYCCNNKDCFVVIKRDGNKWYINEREEPIIVTPEDLSTKMKMSEDDNYHICYESYFLNEEKLDYIRCIYIPNKGIM